MGPSQSKGENVFSDKVKNMKKIQENEDYTVYEEETSQKQYEYWIFAQTKNDYSQEEKIVQNIQDQNYEGIAKIESMKKDVLDKWYSTQYFLYLLTEHPKYPLNEYLQRNDDLGIQTISELLSQIAGAQFMLGVKKQFIGFQNIFTSDGKTWKLKPFLETKSFYSRFKKYFQENKNKLLGFPAPEEFLEKVKVMDWDRVSIFGFGLVILELITKQKSIELYNVDGIDKNKLKESIKLLEKQFLYKGFLSIVIEMIDIDLTRRPNYQQLISKLKSPASGISQILIGKMDSVKVVKGFEGQGLSNQELGFFNKKSSVNPEAIKVINAVSEINNSINLNLASVQLRFRSTIKSRIENLDKTVYEGNYVNGQYQGEGKILLSNGKVLYEGEFDQGKYHNFGTLYNPNPLQLKESFNYQNCKSIDQYAIKYEGKFKHNKKHGEGRLFLTNEEIFCGEFQDDLIHGCGAFQKMDKSSILGQWKNGLMLSTPGFAKQLSSYQSPHFQSSCKYQQQIVQVSPPQSDIPSVSQLIQESQEINAEKISQLSEKKSQILASLTQQKLYFSNTQRQGEILYHDQEKKVKKYLGELLNGKMNGKGTLYFGDGVTIEYEGEFKDDYFDGFGKLENAKPVQTTDIDVKDLRDVNIQGWWISYEGFFRKGKKTGDGRLILTDDSEFMGLFENDCVHGIGYITRKNKQNLYASWEQGILKEVLDGTI